jgi:diaminopimelate decarboxylase
VEQFRYIDDNLWCEKLDLADVARRFGTPAYVYSRQSVIDHCRWIESAFGETPHLSCYAVKANANLEILKVLAAERIGADAGSSGELLRALEAGFPPESITFSGVGKRDDEIELALEKDILAINAESEEEMRAISAIAARLRKRARLFLRVNLDIPTDTHPYITTGRRHNKFGVEASRAGEIMREASKLPSIDMIGIHSHIGSQITKGETFADAARALVDMIGRLRRDGIPLSELNFGGGFGVQYRDYIVHPRLPSEGENPEADLSTVKLLKEVLPILRESGCRILIQPGRSIVAHAGILLTRVLYRKSSGGKTFVIVDAGMNDLIRPSLYQSYHQIVPLRVSDAGEEVADVVGPLCETGDFFALDRPLQRAERGDYLAVLCTGAYGYVLSSNYNGRPRPPEILVDGAQSEAVPAPEWGEFDQHKMNL